MPGRMRLFREVLKDYFGQKWFVSLLLFAIVLFWPTLVFWNQIQFDPVNFTEEWLKLGIGGFAVLLLIEITRRHQEAIVDSRLRRETIINIYLKPIDKLISILSAFDPKQGEPNQFKRDLYLIWEQLNPQLEPPNAEQFLASPNISTILAKLDRVRCNNILFTIAAAETTNQIDSDELKEIIERLSAFKAELVNLIY